ncbi:MAG: aminotransferase class III-fold pyridoxal phosphate-dependent enzyme, partial [Candidatus Binatia bacterium]
MSTQTTIQKTEQNVMNTYARFPVSFVRGEGCYLWDEEGKKYLDLLAGIAVNGLGHSHPRITEALARQAATLIHTSNLFYIKEQAELAELLCRHSFADKVFFSNSGAEANECAIKLARKFQRQKKGPEAYWIVTMEKSFHGRTYATMTATAQAKIKEGFEPLPEGFIHIPYDDPVALETAVHQKTCAVLLEPVQGEGGVRFPAADYLKKAREICDRHGALLIFDEVQTGMG